MDNIKNDLLVVDTETTGTSLNDEILQLSIIDFEGNVLFDEYFCPEHTTDWSEARKVNHITKAMVKNKSTISDNKESLKKILKDKIIIEYNIDFNYRYLVNAGLIEDN